MNKVAKLKHYHPEQEAVQIEESLLCISNASAAIDTRTRFLRDQTLSSIDSTTRAIPQTIEQGLQSLREQADRYFSDMAQAFDRTVSEVAKQRAEEPLRLQNVVYHMVEEYLYRLPSTPYLAAAVERQGSVSPMGSPGVQLASPLVEVGLGQVFAAVGIHPSPAPGQPGANITHISNDLALVLRQTHEMRDSALSRVHYLMREPRFLSWLDTGANRAPSDMLLINGYFEEYARAISPLSVFGAFLASGVLAQQGMSNIVLHHFCTLHTDPRDELAGPKGLLRRLVAQILTHLVRHNVHSLLVDRELLHDSGPEGAHQLNALVELLGRLLEEVPDGVGVFIIIDNISDFETSLYDWGEEMDFVVGRLRSIGKPGEEGGLAPGLRGRVRVLMTCGMKSVGVFRWMEAGRCLSLEAENE